MSADAAAGAKRSTMTKPTPWRARFIGRIGAGPLAVYQRVLDGLTAS
jgi:hypothetical protein